MTHAANMGKVKSSPEHLQALTLLPQLMEQQVPQSGQAAGSKFHSGAIVEVLQNTLKTFKVNKNDVDAEEAEKKHTFDMAQGARKNQIKALEETLEQSEKESADKEEQNNIAKEELAKTTKDRTADKTFMDDLTSQCEEKAAAWDTRSKTRANELTAIAEATKTLKGEVVDNYSANKHLNLAQVKKHSMAFLQVHEGVLKPATVKKMMTYLKGQAQKIKSKNLSNLMVKMTEDHFVKVRGMIKDMVAKLEADAAAEADQKSWCDSEMKKSTEARDEAIANMEGDLAAKTSAHSKIVKLTEEIQDLTTEIAELRKALNEATQLRAIESKDNLKTTADATAGLAGVKKAMKILKEFYDNAFVQTHTKYVPPKADASGMTVGDLAPATFEGEFKGNQDQATGIIGQLDVIKSDFEGTIEATKTAEAEAAEAFDAYKLETEKDISEKEGSISSKEGEKATENSNHQDASDALSDHTNDKALALEELAKLKPACVDTGSDYAEQVARRNQEIESLKNAYVILDEMR